MKSPLSTEAINALPDKDRQALEELLDRLIEVLQRNIDTHTSLLAENESLTHQLAQADSKIDDLKAALDG